MRVKELAYARPRYGHRRLTVLLQREGWTVNHKRIYRIYGEEKTARADEAPKEAELSVASDRSQRRSLVNSWSIDFTSDHLVDGRRLRVFTALTTSIVNAYALRLFSDSRRKL